MTRWVGLLGTLLAFLLTMLTRAATSLWLRSPVEQAWRTAAEFGTTLAALQWWRLHGLRVLAVEEERILRDISW